jgi:hypothetical protein
MYVVASTEVNESFPYGNLFDLDNQTLSNGTDVDGLSCLYEHIHALVIKKMCIWWKINFNMWLISFLCRQQIYRDVHQHMIRLETYDMLWKLFITFFSFLLVFLDKSLIMFLFCHFVSIISFQSVKF